MSETTSLSAYDALRKIADELSVLVREQGSSLKFEDIYEACLLPAVLLWPFLILYMICAIALTASPSPLGSSHVCGILLLILLFFNLVWAVYEVRKKKYEIVSQLQCCISHLLDVVENSFQRDCLKLEEFGKLLQACDTAAILSSPSHSVSRVYKREVDIEVLRYIPTTLLATGDHISLCPGQVAPAKLLSVMDQRLCIEKGDIYDEKNFQSNSSCDSDNEIVSERFEVSASPIVEDIKLYLDNFHDLKKSEVTVFERQRRYVLGLIMTYIIPALVLNDSTEILFSVLSPPLWYIHLLQTPAFLCVPFFPFFLHALCTMLITIGEAKTLAVYRVADKETARYVAIPNTLTLSSQAIAMKHDDLRGIKWWRIFRDLLFGKRQNVTHRIAGLFLPLGSLTVLCCLDKEGILSWLNPITEKVFFFKNIGQEITNQSPTLPIVAEHSEDTAPESDEVMVMEQEQVV